MQKAILLAAGAALSLASMTASAASISYKTEALEVVGVLQEIAGPSARCPTQFGGTITGHGMSTTLGPLAFVANDCITPSGAIFTFNKGRFIILTASGDQVFASYSGQMVPTGVGTQYTFTGGTFQITGGTGQYIFATGGGALDGGEDMATGAGNIKLTGKISYWTW